MATHFLPDLKKDAIFFRRRLRCLPVDATPTRNQVKKLGRIRQQGKRQRQNQGGV